MEQKIDQLKWIWPSLIILSAGVAGSLAFTNSVFGLRPLVALWFLLVCPGMAFVRLLSIKETVVQWTLAVAISLALDAFVSAILVYAHIWSSNVALVILIAVSLLGVSLQVIPEKRLPSKKPTRTSLRVNADELWYRKVVNSVNNRTAELKSVINTVSHDILPISLQVSKKSYGKILLVESHETVSASICSFMQASGYEMASVHSDDEAVKIITDAKPDLILLDLELPGNGSWDVLHRMRERSSVPVIVLTTKREEADILHGFHLGANDYVTKPFSIVELEGCVAAVLSHSRSIYTSKDRVISGKLTINFERRQVLANGRIVNLTPIEYRLLETLARHANHTIPLGRLLTDVRGSSYKRDKQYIKRYILSLRKKIEADPGKPKHIITRRGYGYRFE